MRKANARERILETAGELFRRQGYGLVGINEIIAKSETAKASFYQHFPSKELLCAEWLKEMHARSETSHAAILGDEDSAITKIEAYFAELRNWLLENDFRGCPYTNTASMLNTDAPAIRQQVEIHKRFIRDFFVELSRGIDGVSDPEELGSALFLLYSGATAEAQNVRATWPVDTAIAATRRLIREVEIPEVEDDVTLL